MSEEAFDAMKLKLSVEIEEEKGKMVEIHLCEMMKLLMLPSKTKSCKSENRALVRQTYGRTSEAVCGRI
ncbi:hypothetical protein F2Q70_00032714 [Brassica cretica]|uniref:Uncharacterized protein n=1 Tax=Brassica cretica TaxID=69181 RepID=A0A3N6R667_BRACR|nr:hypothetical protein F2Q70_00032714 [Brassica cretica]KAF3597449.1 hypothetical protein DY000_02026730 [Brassica cretica]